MLKSKFNLSEKEDEINEAEEIVEEEARISAKEEAEQAGEVESIFKHEFVERKLGKYEVTVKLSMLGRTADGDGYKFLYLAKHFDYYRYKYLIALSFFRYTYLKATLTGMSLTNIDAIKFYRHLQFVDLSNNSLDLDGMQAVTSLPYLCLIQADYNFMYSAALKKTKYLQVIILNNNYLTSVYDVFQPELSTLEVGNNKIQKINFLNRMPNLKCLDFRNNVVEDVLDLDFPLLDSLYLAGNKIRSLVGLEKLVNLRILHLRNNPIRLLDGFDPNMAKLQYINLRNCKVSSMIQIKKLRVSYKKRASRWSQWANRRLTPRNH